MRTPLAVVVLLQAANCPVAAASPSALLAGPTHTLSYRGTLSGPVVFSPDGRWLACTSNEHDVVLWDLRSRRASHVLHPDVLFNYSAAFSPDSKMLATGGHDNDVRLWDAKSGKLVRTLAGTEYGNRTCGLQFTADGRTVAASTYHGYIEFWDARTGVRRRVIQNGWRAQTLAISPDNRSVAVSISDGAQGDFVQLYAVRSGHPLRRLRAAAPIAHLGDFIWGIAYSRDGRLIATGSQATLRLWYANTGRRIKDIDLHKDLMHEVFWLSFLPGDRTLVSSGTDGKVRFWSIPSGKLAREMNVGSGINGFAISRAGKTMAYAAHGVVQLRSLQ